MTSAFKLFALVLVAAWAWVTTAIRRVLLGPTLPSWSWLTELNVASTRAVIRRAASTPDDPTLVTVGARATMPVRRGSAVAVRRVRIAGLRADRYVPTSPRHPQSTLLYFHGGGYVFGNPGTHRRLIAQLVETAGMPAVAPDYRLAPAHPYPAAVDDAEAVYQSILDRSDDPGSIILAGDSSGGGLAAALVVRIRRMGLPGPGGLLMFSPYLDLTHRSYTMKTNAATDYLPTTMAERPNDFYTTQDLLEDPEVSPLNADLSDFPPIMVFAGGAEMLLGDSLRFAEEAKAAGADVTLVVEPEMMHVWPAFAEWQPESERAIETAGRWLEERGHEGPRHID